MQSFGLIGKSLSHSYSKQLFEQTFDTKLFSYHLFELDSIEEVIPLIQNTSLLKGFNVTIPYKQAIIPFLDEIDNTAEAIQSVNCVKIERITPNLFSLKGFNTDYLAFYESIQPLILKSDQKALILGTGGASLTVEYALKKLGIECYFVSRNTTKKRPNILNYEDLKGELAQYSIIVNTTPVGMFPKVEEQLPFPYEEITQNHLIYDLIYNPENTFLIKTAKKQQSRFQNGIKMLSLQAINSWKNWKI